MSLNVAYALAQLGTRVVLVDADLGAANLHSMCGIDHPGPTLQAFIDKRVESLEEVIVQTRYRGLSLLPGSGAVLGAANLAHAQKTKVLRHIRKLDTEVVLIDVGAGVSFNVVDFYSLADLQLTVATPQLTSLQNSYSFVKATVFRRLAELAREAGQEDLFTRSTTRGETERVGDLLGRIAAENPDLAKTMRASLRLRRGGIIGNQMESRSQTNVLHALSRMLRDFLGVDAPVLTALCQNPRINRSVTKRVPFLSEPVTDAESTALRTLAERLLEMGAQRPRAEDVAPSSLDDLPLPRIRRTPVPSAPVSQTTAKSSNLPAPARGLDGHLHHYLRKDDRYGVAWSAIVRTGFDTQAVRVQDISLGGASLAMRQPASTLDEVVVVFDSVPGRPEFQCKVRHVDAMNGRCGVEFHGEAARKKAESLVQLAIAQGGRMVPDVRTHAA